MNKIIDKANELRDYEEMAKSAFNEWCPGSSINVIKKIGGGYSGAILLKVDISNPGKEFPSGQYILKLYTNKKWEGEDREGDRHKIASSINEKYAQQHIPSLVRQYFQETPGAGNIESGALLYEVAGNSFNNTLSIESINEVTFKKTPEKVLSDLLNNWCDEEPPGLRTPSILINDWLGYRIDPKSGKNLHDFIKENIPEEPEFIVSNTILINPLWFCSYDPIMKDDSDVFFNGFIHGDLHLGNILADIHKYEHYWIIDFANARKASLGFDHAYLEVALLLRTLESVGVEQLLGILSNLDKPSEKNSNSIPLDKEGLLNLLSSVRDSTQKWMNDKHKRRKDTLEKQFTLARVAAGLNWANKDIDIRLRKLSLYYASWYARIYIETFRRDIWCELGKSSNISNDDLEVKRAKSAKDIEPLWNEIWENVEKFDSTRSNYVLVTGPLSDEPNLKSLGFLPWSVVIDLDPDSDESGLHSVMAPTLKKHRGVHIFDFEDRSYNFGFGTAWMMAGGWTREAKPKPNINDWRRKYWSYIRKLFIKLRQQIMPNPITVLVLPTFGDGEPEKYNDTHFFKIIEAIDEVFGEDAKIICIGNEKRFEESYIQYLPYPVHIFVEKISSVFGTDSSFGEYKIPGLNNEMISLSIDNLRNFEESLDVMHSGILDATLSRHSDKSNNPFWRGNPPTWNDLFEDMDIQRDIHDELVKSLEDELNLNRNHTLVLAHTPGAGGTTAALRSAWALHQKYPVAILRQYNNATAARINELFHLVKRPILILADSAVLLESMREKFYRELAEQNCRVVLLYVTGSISLDDENGTHQLKDPMGQKEADKFYRLYSSLTEDDWRKNGELRRITYQKDMSKYRSPFFYGLIAFGRDFCKVDEYVNAHIKNVTSKALNVLQYIAFITKFSATGMPKGLLKLLLALPTNSKLELGDMLGEGPARLLIENSGFIKIMHPVLAEEVLNDLKDEYKTDDLKNCIPDFAMKFIDQVNISTDVNVEIIRNMFAQLFIERQRRIGGRESDSNFSELIDFIDDNYKCIEIFKKLTEIYPKDSHFWNHRARYLLYKIDHYDEALKCIDKAIELNEDVPIHHHTRGQILRIKVDSQIVTLRDSAPEIIIEKINDHFKSALDSFTKQRGLDPNDNHGYITPAQMILKVAKRLLNSADVKSIDKLGEQHPNVLRWFNEYIPEARRLLEISTQLISKLKSSNKYYLKSLADLSDLYGDIDAAIRTLEVSIVRCGPDNHNRRALAHAYLQKRKWNWFEMPEAELKRIFDLTEDNLSKGDYSDGDYIIWVQAYSHLPDFDLMTAIQRLKFWADRFNSVNAYYYLYVFQFILWFLDEHNISSEILKNIENSKERKFGKRRFSLNWFGWVPQKCPLLDNNGLGGWNERRNFYNKPELLRRVNGTIKNIQGPQAGTIHIDGIIPVFFPPGTNFFKDKDEGEKVNFFLGFGYEGLHAWNHERGWVEEGARSRRSISKKINKSPLSYSSAITSEEANNAAILSLRRRVKKFISDLIMAKNSRNSKLLLIELEKCLIPAIGSKNLYEKLGFQSLNDLLESFNELEIKKVDSSPIVQLRVLIDNDKTLSEGIKARSLPLKIGIIKYLKKDLEFGYIKVKGEKEDYRFEMIDVSEGDVKFLRKRISVSFKPSQGEKGAVAKAVSVYNKNLSLKGK